MPADDGAMFFDDKVVDADEYQGPLSTTSSVVRGLMAFADVASGKLAVSWLIYIIRHLHVCWVAQEFAWHIMEIVLLSRNEMCRFQGTKFWDWQNIFLALGCLEISMISLIKLML